jgi:hypothetical protein
MLPVPRSSLGGTEDHPSPTQSGWPKDFRITKQLSGTSDSLRTHTVWLDELSSHLLHGLAVQYCSRPAEFLQDAS